MTRHPTRTSAALTAFCLLLLVAAPAWAQDKPAARIYGKVKKAEDGGPLELRTRHGTFDVAREGEVGYFAIGSLAQLGKAAQGARIVVLARRQEELQDPNTMQTQPEQIVQVQAVLVIDDDAQAFEAPPLAKAHEERRLEWMTGKLKLVNNGFALDESGKQTNLQWGKKRPVLRISPGSEKAVKKNALLLVTGTVTGTKALDATAVFEVGKRIPQDQLAALLE